ncbi:hypothetical protein [Cyclobacterium marinum]|uniref:hypothetical protein n=1 Tax=Cyclobacterium marinum TaxID=104 RepID=UPI0018DC8222|nr:hypothetical protein [Cyclobacterium marinum]MBI0399105.1 hypothetical protein [Cyclobacterium marinum]
MFKLYNRFKNLEGIDVFLDFTRTSFVDANLCALVEAILYKLAEDCNHRFYSDMNDLKNRFDVFTRNGFLKSNNLKSEPYDARHTTVKLTNFEANDADKFCNYLEYDLFAHRAFKNKPEIKDNLMGHFLEIFANIQLHAKTELPVFACGQYYPSIEILKFTLVDLGIGFFEPISKYTKGEIDTPEKAIQWAVNGNSTKIDAPGGLGLSVLKSFFSSDNHSMQLNSDGKCWENKSGLLDLGKYGEFPGTTIHLEFCCN